MVPYFDEPQALGRLLQCWKEERDMGRKADDAHSIYSRLERRTDGTPAARFFETCRSGITHALFNSSENAFANMGFLSASHCPPQHIPCDFGLYANATNLSQDQKLLPNEDITGAKVTSNIIMTQGQLPNLDSDYRSLHHHRISRIRMCCLDSY